jgi:glyoxylase-like metal-dependent hydrolase (beta-lactamase superfamily II)
MKRILTAVLLTLFIGACGHNVVAPPQPEPQMLITHALDAMGHVGATATLHILSVKGSAKFWEPEQSNVPGGEMRFANESTFEMTRDFASNSSRIDWVRNFAYPAPRTFTYSEIVTPRAGYVIGVDSNGRNKQSLSMKPPAHAMSGQRLAATQRELHRMSPELLMEMRHNPGKVSLSGNIFVGDVAYPALRYDAGAYTFFVAFDPKSGLPVRIRTLDYDNIWGDVNYDVALSDWRTFGELKLPTTWLYQLNGRTVAEYRIAEVAFDAPVSAERFTAPAAVMADAPGPADGWVDYQWALRRQFIGTYTDSASTSFDASSSSGLRLNVLAPGVQHVVGGTHNSLIVEMSDYLIVFDAPVSDWQSKWTIAAAKAKYPEKPVRYLVLTHHHMDHAGGMRAYVAQGATLVVGRGAADHYRKALAAPYLRNPDITGYDLGGTRIIEVADKQVFSDGKREVSAILYENPHAASTLMGYVEDARIAYVADVYTPGPPLPAKINPALASVVSAVKKAGLQPQLVAGGHGGTAPYAPLAQLAGN